MVVKLEDNSVQGIKTLKKIYWRKNLMITNFCEGSLRGLCVYCLWLVTISLSLSSQPVLIDIDDFSNWKEHIYIFQLKFLILPRKFQSEFVFPYKCGWILENKQWVLFISLAFCNELQDFLYMYILKGVRKNSEVLMQW